MIVIDGSYGEGGGQIVRSTLALAAITGQAVRIGAIRAGRKQPGLQAQHLTAARAAAAVCNASVRGDALGSMTLEFAPGGPAQAGDYGFDVAQARHGSSAGAATLVFQTVFLPLAASGGSSHLLIKGGTHVPWSPPFHYLKHVFLPAVWHLGLRADLKLGRYGWYPAGGGELEFQILNFKFQTPNSSLPLASFDFQLTERGELRRVWGLAAVSNLPSHIAQRMANRAVNLLATAGIKPVKINAEHVEASGPGVGIFIFAEYQHIAVGFCAYGRKGLPAEKVAEEACQDLLGYHHTTATADPHLADQLVLPAALFASSARWTTSRLTQHMLTNIWVAQQFIDRKIEVTGAEGQVGQVVIE